MLLSLALGAALAALVALAGVGVDPVGAAFPGANGRIAFTSDRTTGTGVNNPTGDYEIFTMNKDGTGLTQLTFNTTHDYRPSWSADGSGMVFTSERDGNAEIYTMNSDGSNQTRLTNNSTTDRSPAISPDGSKIAFESDRDGNWEIYTMDSDGTDPTNISNNPATDLSPDWSPNGEKIAFTSYRGDNWDIFVINALDGSSQKRLTKKAAYDVIPAWSPNGKKITFESDRGGGDLEIYAMKARPEGSKNRPINLTKNDVVSDGLPDWQPLVN
jgi:Tol biopolymer transport system component